MTKPSYILTDAGMAKLEARLSELFRSGYDLSEVVYRSGLDRDTVTKIRERKKGVNKKSLENLFSGLDLDPADSDCEVIARPNNPPITNHKKQRSADWGGDCPDVSVFYGRTKELAMLEQWAIAERCRLVALLGMGGVGKTWLAVKLAQQIQNEFKYVYRRSLQSPPPLTEFLENLINFLSDRQECALAETTEDRKDRISQLIKYLCKYRCLLVLDNVTGILESGQLAGRYREGYEDYGDLIKRLGDQDHQSCIVLTIGEEPPQISFQKGDNLPVRSLPLTGLDAEAAKEICKAKGLSGSKPELERLINFYRGNPLMLNIVAIMINDVFNKNVSYFLDQKSFVHGDLEQLLYKQFKRLSPPEQKIMERLASENQPLTQEKLQEYMQPEAPSQVLTHLQSLLRRSLIEKTRGNEVGFMLQPAWMEYVTNRIREQQQRLID